MSHFFPNGSLMVVRTTAFPTPHARISYDLGLSLLVTGMWLENHLFGPSSLLGCQGPRPPRYASMPPPPRPLTREPNETPPCPAEPFSWPCLRGPTFTFGQRPSPRTGRYNTCIHFLCYYVNSIFKTGKLCIVTGSGVRHIRNLVKRLCYKLV